MTKGFIPQYVLADSWVITDEFLKSILNRGSRRKQQVDVLNLMKGCRKDQYQERPITQIYYRRYLKARSKRAERRNVDTLQSTLLIKRHGLRHSLIMMNGQRSWKLLVTTDEKLSFIKAMEYCHIRSTIKAFFRKAKQDLRLGKSQSNDFDALIATYLIGLYALYRSGAR